LPVLFLVRVNLGRRLRTKLESWDIVQEALLKSLSDLDSFKYEREDAFRRYLSSKVNQVIRDHADYWSAARRDPSREEPLYFQTGAGSSACDGIADFRQTKTPSEIVCLDEDLTQLAEALDELADEAPDVWDVIVAVKVVGRGIREFAEEKGISYDAAKMRLRRGMVKLARIFRKLNNPRKSVDDSEP
jgi:RNA polymerase sigma factor (sigma-70 family)